MKLLKILLSFATVAYALVCVTCLECSAPPPDNQYDSITLRNGCPKVPYVTNVNLNLTAGVWYQHWGTVNGSQAGCSGDCVNMYVAPYNENEITQDYCCNNDGSALCGYKVGSSEVTQDASNPAKLTYTIWNYAVQLYYVDIKYSDYMVTYKCFDQDRRRTEVGEIWGRSPRLSDCEDCDDLYDKLNAIFVDKELLQPISQDGNCRYPWRR